MHKEFIPEGKTIIAELYKGILDHLLKRVQRLRPATFCSQDFLLLCLPVFNPPKKLQPFITSVISSFISARLFSVPKVENEVKKTPIFGCCWDPKSRNWWIKEDPKRGIFGSFSETVRPGKSLYICQWSVFWIKKRYVFLTCLRFLKNQSLKFWTISYHIKLCISNYYLTNLYTSCPQWLLDCCDHRFESHCKFGCLSVVLCKQQCLWQVYHCLSVVLCKQQCLWQVYHCFSVVLCKQQCLWWVYHCLSVALCKQQCLWWVYHCLFVVLCKQQCLWWVYHCFRRVIPEVFV